MPELLKIAGSIAAEVANKAQKMSNRDEGSASTGLGEAMDLEQSMTPFPLGGPVGGQTGSQFVMSTLDSHKEALRGGMHASCFGDACAAISHILQGGDEHRDGGPTLLSLAGDTGSFSALLLAAASDDCAMELRESIIRILAAIMDHPEAGKVAITALWEGAVLEGDTLRGCILDGLAACGRSIANMLTWRSQLAMCMLLRAVLRALETPLP